MWHAKSSIHNVEDIHNGEDIRYMLYAHSGEASQYFADPEADTEYIPIWKREEHSQSVSVCMYPECTATSGLFEEESESESYLDYEVITDMSELDVHSLWPEL